jgi:signal transduction histidine kinase/CheY-like chemotaxis protein
VASSEQFLAIAKAFPEPLFLVTGEGDILAVNQPVLDLLEVDSTSLLGNSICEFTSTPRKQLLQYLRNCSRSRVMVPGSLSLPNTKASKTLFSCEGAMIEPWSKDKAAVVLLRINLKESSLSRFSILTEKIEQLNKEIIDRKRAEEALQKSLKDSSLLAELSHLIASNMNYESTLKEVAHLLVTNLADICFIDLLTKDHKLHRVATKHANPQMEELLSNSGRFVPPKNLKDHPITKALTNSRPVTLTSITEEDLQQMAMSVDHLRFLHDLKLSSLVAVPLIARGQTLGALTLGRLSPGSNFSPQEIQLFSEIASRIALSLQNAQLYRETEEASRLKDEFLATVSHELRTPLTAILGWSRMLKSGRIDPDTFSRALDTIERNAQAQSQLIEDLLDISRIVSGKLRLDVQTIEPLPVIEAAIDSIRPAANAKNIRIKTVLNPDAGPIFADPSRLQQIIWNLLINSVKFTPKEGRIEILLLRVGSNVKITVTDTGRGIDPDFLPFVFDRFRQADSRSTRKQGGLGLGLSIVKHLVELHGGIVEVESEGLGKGATFIVTLPLIAVRHERIEPEYRLNKSDNLFDCPPTLEGLRILVVDDETDTRDLLEAILTQCQAKVFTFSSVAEAWEVIDNYRPDVIISDIEMPEINGYEFIHRLRGEKQRWIPAIALTAYARAEDRMRALAAGFQMHLSKPVDPIELVMVVASIVEKRRLKEIKDNQ